MSDKSGKKKAKKAAKQPGVLGSLPTTRPTRLGGTRAPGPPRPAARRPAPSADGAPATPPVKAVVVSAPGAPPLDPPPAQPAGRGGPPPPGRVVAAAARAAGELAQLTAAYGSQTLRRTAARLYGSR